MENMNKYNLTEIKSYKNILQTIKRFDSEFIPSITRRIPDLQNYVRKLADNAVVYTAIDNHEIIGFIAFYANNGNFSFIALIAVLKSYRKRGIGQILIEKCLEISKNRHISKVQLEVLKDNVQAIKFYEKLGFYFINPSNDKSYLMERNITNE